MTQYQSRRSEGAITAEAESIQDRTTHDNTALERNLKSLTQHVQKQDDELRDLRKIVKKLQNEVRLAVNTFNTKNHG